MARTSRAASAKAWNEQRRDAAIKAAELRRRDAENAVDVVRGILNSAELPALERLKAAAILFDLHEKAEKRLDMLQPHEKDELGLSIP